MTENTKTVLLRFVRSSAAVALAGLIGFIASPAALDIVGDKYAVLITAVAIPVLTAADKWLRGGTPDAK